MLGYRFGGLPEDLSVGAALVTPRDELSKLIQPCSFCNRLSYKYSLCSNSHVICFECMPPCQDRTNAWCISCRKTSSFAQINVPLDVVSAMEFFCACGYIGRLSKIREHLIKQKTESQLLCHGLDSKVRRQIDSIENYSIHEIDDAHYLKILSQIHTELQNQYRTLEAIQGPQTALKELIQQKAFKELSLTPKQIVCLKMSHLFNWKPTFVRKVFDGVPLKMRFMLTEDKNSLYIAVHVAGGDFFPSLNPWPLKKLITVRLHDCGGRAVAGTTFCTFSKGKMLHESFQDPTGVRTAIGSSKAFNLTEIFSKMIGPVVIRDRLLFSITLKELDSVDENAGLKEKKTSCSEKPVHFNEPESTLEFFKKTSQL